MSRIVLVLGCHRSGTSLIAKSLECLGVSLGTHLQPPAFDNQAGFNEDLDFQTVNASVLQAAGATWDTVGTINIARTTASGQLLRALLEDRTRRYPIFGVKDPRFCRTLPFWRKVLPAEIEVSCVYALRHPTEVMRSLNKRNSFSEAKGYALWLVNTIDALTQADPAWPKIVVDYGRMLSAPQMQIERIASALNLNVDTDKIKEFTETAVRPDLRHNEYLHSGQATIEHDLVNQLYDLLYKIARDEAPIGFPSSGQFLAIANKVESMGPILRGMDAIPKPGGAAHRHGEFRWPG